MATLFISDLHIDASRRSIIRQFTEVLQTQARAADALYILGDLFDSWVGDDAPDDGQRAAIAAIKEGAIHPGDVLVLMCRGPLGSGMEEIFEITAALRYLDYSKYVAVITDARFSGVSTGACIGHVTPEALAGGPLGKVREGDAIEIVVDCVNLDGSVNLLVNGSAEEGARALATRSPEGLAPDPDLPPETRLWAALQEASGGAWAGCVFDVDAIIKRLR